MVIRNKTPKTTDVLLNERGSTHGSFTDNARISQTMKRYFRENGWESLSSVQQEALDMIALKISRILSGKADEADHWADIQGYAKLASKDALDQAPASVHQPRAASILRVR